MSTRLFLWLSLILLAAACSSTGDGTPTGQTDPDTTAAGAGETPSTTTALSPTTTVTYPSIAADLGVALIDQHTPIDGEGRRPVLEWTAVDGAERYFVIVSAPSGAIYWGWRTSDTSVPVGGNPKLVEGAAGPAVSEGMTWIVSALDAEGNVVGISARRPISP